MLRYTSMLEIEGEVAWQIMNPTMDDSMETWDRFRTAVMYSLEGARSYTYQLEKDDGQEIKDAKHQYIKEESFRGCWYIAGPRGSTLRHWRSFVYALELTKEYAGKHIRKKEREDDGQIQASDTS